MGKARKMAEYNFAMRLMWAVISLVAVAIFGFVAIAHSSPPSDDRPVPPPERGEGRR